MQSINNKGLGAVELDQLFESYVETNLFQQLTTSAADRYGSTEHQLCDFMVPFKTR
jgi:hypothetical protein